MFDAWRPNSGRSRRRRLPVVAIAVCNLIVLASNTCHASFLLSGRNSFYLINTASIIVANAIPVICLRQHLRHRRRRLGPTGRRHHRFVCALASAAGRFPVPLRSAGSPLTMIAALVMALTVAARPKPARADLTAASILVLHGLGQLCGCAGCSRSFPHAARV